MKFKQNHFVEFARSFKISRISTLIDKKISFLLLFPSTKTGKSPAAAHFERGVGRQGPDPRLSTVLESPNFPPKQVGAKGLHATFVVTGDPEQSLSSYTAYVLPLRHLIPSKQLL
jgi:hypothetical protein